MTRLDYSGSTDDRALVDPIPNSWVVMPLRHLTVGIESGTSVNAVDRPAEAGEVGVLKTSCVYTGEFRIAENKAVVVDDVERVACPVVVDRLIVSRMNTPDLVGAAGLVKESSRDIYLPDRLWQIAFRSDVEPAFIHYWTRSASYRSQVQQACSGTSSSMQNLSQEQFRSFVLALPSLVDQRSVVRFLDRETARIDTLIARQERLIELLQEKRQALITRAVTKGLDLAVPMKDSGVEWLGEVPAHWDISRLSRVCTAWCDGPFGSAIASEHYTDDGALVVRLQNIKEGFYDDKDRAYLDHQYFANRLAKHEVIPGDLLIAGLGDDNNPVGRSCVAPAELGPALVKADCFRFRVDANAVDAHYLAALLTSGSRWAAGFMSGGSTRSRIPLSKMAGRKIVLPPITEQHQIVRCIETGKSTIDALLEKARTMIDLSKEHRAALISAAVTGKIDVREPVSPVSDLIAESEAA